MALEGCGALEAEMKPQNYAARTAYRPPAAWYRRTNGLGVLLTSAGLAPRDAVTLQVRGRTTGKTRRVPILRTRHQGAHYLVALAGESQWVRNVRAADGHAIIRRRGARGVHLEELAPAERPEIIAEYLRAGRRRSGIEASAKQARFYFGLDPDPSMDDIRAIAENYPVFRVAPAVRPHSVLDRYLPEFDVRERRTRLLHAEMGTVRAAIGQTDLTGIPVVRALLVLRALPGRLRARLGGPATPIPPPFTLADMPGAGWTALTEESQEVAFGTLTHPWRMGNEAPLEVDRETFAPFCTPGYAKVAFSIRADPAGPYRTWVTTETRVTTTDPRSKRRFAAYWVVVGPLSALIRRLVLRRLASHVEHQ